MGWLTKETIVAVIIPVVLTSLGWIMLFNTTLARDDERIKALEARASQSGQDVEARRDLRSLEERINDTRATLNDLTKAVNDLAGIQATAAADRLPARLTVIEGRGQETASQLNALAAALNELSGRVDSLPRTSSFDDECANLMKNAANPPSHALSRYSWNENRHEKAADSYRAILRDAGCAEKPRDRAGP
ncbi:MAG: hypothetical protein Q4G22_08850 [Paracoccus sp. (in: a-proteobacteria)]|uniref:hypothetical protein n=1 Tax=Paracoccus sp. TaxID=267 RepID=UPI0026E002A8|nr:hypothetical protein [Paracoccus sp. (in: a-proteobacteria)]MDO5631933.1 hypothetical protein [Paracoccus sp. (in: a-proteobacteria)]